MTMPTATMNTDVNAVSPSDIAGGSRADGHAPSADRPGGEGRDAREGRPAGRTADDYLRIDVC